MGVASSLHFDLSAKSSEAFDGGLGSHVARDTSIGNCTCLPREISVSALPCRHWGRCPLWQSWASRQPSRTLREGRPGARHGAPLRHPCGRRGRLCRRMRAPRRCSAGCSAHAWCMSCSTGAQCRLRVLKHDEVLWMPSKAESRVHAVT